MIRVMIVDDQHVVRRGLSLLIAGFEDMMLVGEASGGREAVALCASARPDIVLMDMVMPDLDGVAATRTILEAYPDVRVVALTSFTDRELIQDALRAGVVGYLLKDASVDELAEAIRSAYQGRPVVAWKATQALIEPQTSPAPPDVLTDREHEVLSLMVEGLTNRQIAARLAISPYTVNAHVRSIFSKLGVSSRAEAVSHAIQAGLIP
ncbi:MAG: response regulator transcription factor [Anaerolineae bacterium]